MKRINKIQKEKGYEYRIDKEGNIIEEKYSWIKDRWTLVVICILILAGAYYFQAQSSKANINNLDNTCETYLQFKQRWISEHPSQVPNAKEILKTAIENNWKINNPLNK